MLEISTKAVPSSVFGLEFQRAGFSLYGAANLDAERSGGTDSDQVASRRPDEREEHFPTAREQIGCNDQFRDGAADGVIDAASSHRGHNARRGWLWRPLANCRERPADGEPCCLENLVHALAGNSDHVGQLADGQCWIASHRLDDPVARCFVHNDVSLLTP